MIYREIKEMLCYYGLVGELCEMLPCLAVYMDMFRNAVNWILKSLTMMFLMLSWSSKRFCSLRILLISRRLFLNLSIILNFIQGGDADLLLRITVFSSCNLDSYETFRC